MSFVPRGTFVRPGRGRHALGVPEGGCRAAVIGGEGEGQVVTKYLEESPQFHRPYEDVRFRIEQIGPAEAREVRPGNPREDLEQSTFALRAYGFGIPTAFDFDHPEDMERRDGPIGGAANRSAKGLGFGFGKIKSGQHLPHRLLPRPHSFGRLVRLSFGNKERDLGLPHRRSVFEIPGDNRNAYDKINRDDCRHDERMDFSFHRRFSFRFGFPGLFPDREESREIGFYGPISGRPVLPVRRAVRGSF